MADTEEKLLSLLVSILAKTLLTLVRRHFVSLMLLSVWHNKLGLKNYIDKLLLYFVYEYLSRLESWDVVSWNCHSSVLSNVSSSLLSSVLDDEATESTEIYWVTLGE